MRSRYQVVQKMNNKADLYYTKEKIIKEEEQSSILSKKNVNEMVGNPSLPEKDN